ncbi:MAG: putative Ig domain-containing protein, partial [Leucothrix sp.]
PLFIASGGESCLWVEYYVNGQVASTNEQCITFVSGGSNYSLTFNAYSSAPLEITHSQQGIYGINFTATPILLRPASIEQSVSYSIISGVLPNGMSLVATGATKAQIQGTPTETGSFSVVVEGTDSDDNTNTTTVSFDVLAQIPPSLAPSVLWLKHPTINNPVTFDLTPYNSGGVATTWAIVGYANSPCCVSISNSGIISFSDFVPGYEWEITATNSAGSSNTMYVITALGTM